MKFEHREPDDSVNVSAINPLREVLVLVFGLSAAFGVVALILVLLADRMALYLPVSFEQTLLGVVKSDFGEDPKEPNLYLTELVGKLASGWEDNPYTFEVWLIEAEEANAMALPGGLILVTRPLLAKVTSENALALVLGHELGHFRNRDHLRGLSRQVVLTLLLNGLTGGSTGAGWLFQHVGHATSSGFDRAQETACDAFGLMLLDSHYGHVGGATEFFEAMVDRELGAGLNYLRSHPVSADRISAIEAEVLRQGYVQQGSLKPLPEL